MLSGLRARAAPLWRSQQRFISALMSYGASQGLMKGLDFVSFVILVRALSARQLGFIGLTTLSSVFLIDGLTLGLTRIGVPRFVIDPDCSREQIIRNGVSFQVLYSLAVAAAMQLLPDQAFAALGYPGYGSVFRLIVYGLLLRGLVSMYFEIMRLERRSGLLAILEPLPSLVYLLALLALFPFFPNKLQAAAIAQIVPWVVFALGFAAAHPHHLRPDLSQIGKLVRFSGPQTLQRLMDEICNAGDRWIVLFALGADAVGAYTFVYRLGDVMKLACMPIQKAFMPQLLKFVSVRDLKSADHLALVSFAATSVIFVVCLALAYPVAALVDTRRRFGFAFDAIPVVMLSHLIYQTYIVVGVGFYVARKAVYILPITLAALAVNLAGSWCFARYLGLVWTPYGTLLGNVVLLIGSYAFGRRYFSYGSPKVAQLAFTGLFGFSMVFVLLRVLR